MTQDSMPPEWRRPDGVAPGTWRYIHQRSIARHYDQFVADTPLCELDVAYLKEHLLRKTSDLQPETICQSRPPLVLDLGCGTGRVAFPTNELGLDVLAIDLSQPMLEELAGRNSAERAAREAESEPSVQSQDEGDPHESGRRSRFVGKLSQSDGKLSQSTGNMIPVSEASSVSEAVVPLRASLVDLDCLRDGIADHAFCMFSTLGMIAGHTNRLKCLRHVHRALRPGGTFVFHVHRRWAALREPGGAKQLLQSWLRSRGKSTGEFGDWTYAYRGLPDMFMHRFDCREIRRLVKDSGLKLDRIDRIKLDGTGLTSSRLNTGGYFVVCSKR
ncbi:methyltransferase domain-containing protein [Stieleria sp. JC731]|uniref:class I SAM-dependent methyltransferase n=1 Tax=Pirellulaceae TaxID=2691357 RepID=UPI001E4BB623|nr:class I SAM-dependent methyltransferase [Stieleria sp. JC731]MCC9599268.1 methyltransferase domain-containing protein [Stieleria sp. JC731]